MRVKTSKGTRVQYGDWGLIVSHTKKTKEGEDYCSVDGRYTLTDEEIRELL